jgi:hypothetical protein
MAEDIGEYVSTSGSARSSASSSDPGAFNASSSRASRRHRVHVSDDAREITGVTLG